MEEMRNKFLETMEKYGGIDWLSSFAINIGISVVYVIAGGIIIKIANRLIKKSLKLDNTKSKRKKETMEAVLSSLTKYGIWFVIICFILGQFGIDISSLIALAGVSSIVIGIGAQSLVQDVITGAFILFEDQFGIGDIITVGSFTGTVESIGLRSTRLRSLNGDLHIIPNGVIKTITNMSKEFNRASVYISVCYEEDIDKALHVIEDEMKNIYEGEKIFGLIDMPKVLGVVKFAESSIDIQILADTKVGENWSVEREIRRLMKIRFDKEGINMPYPVRVLKIEREEKI